jgi:hypothetical protein
MRRFRNVLFKASREYTGSPEYDFVELEPIADSLLHLAFLFDRSSDREIRVTLTDTWMMGQEVAPQSSIKVGDIDGGHTELVTEYKLTKGRHYALTVYYVGGGGNDEHGVAPCSVYDLTVSISHVPKVHQATTCSSGRPTDSLGMGLTHVITDRELDGDGAYSFNKTLRLQYPQDFKKLTKVMEGSKEGNALLEWVSIDLSKNYDLRASIDWEFDQALFTLGFTETVSGDAEEQTAEVSHEQGPLVFKRNNDHYLTVRRELVAEGVESEKRTHKHTLTIENR